MARPEKVAAVEEIREKLEGSTAIFVTEYRGLTVAQMQKLRRSLREADTEYKIYKMTLTRRAAEEAGFTEMVEWLEGPTALAFTAGDPVPSAKGLHDFATGNDNLVLKGGILRGQLLDASRIGELAALEPREVLLAKAAGAMKAPMSSMAGLMKAVIRQVASVVHQLAEKGGGGGAVAASADEAAAEEDSVDEATEAAAEEATEAQVALEEEAGETGSEPGDEAEEAEAETEATADEAATEDTDADTAEAEAAPETAEATDAPEGGAEDTEAEPAPETAEADVDAEATEAEGADEATEDE